MNINWYPGHMKKTLDKLEKSIKKVDLVLEVVDARIPISSSNPSLDKLIADKKRIVILNKADLADDKENQRWKNYLESKGYGVIIAKATDPKSFKNLRKLGDKLLEEKFLKDEKKGIKDRTIHMMVVGIPNVGKSTLINTLAGRKGAKTGNKAGVTKSEQWIKTGKDMVLLDTPGLLWPKFEEGEGLSLAVTGAIKEEVLDVASISLKLIEKLKANKPEILESRYKVTTEGKKPIEIMEDIGRKRGALVRGGLIDYDKTGRIIFNEFRKGQMGRISLETVDEVRD